MGILRLIAGATVGYVIAREPGAVAGGLIALLTAPPVAPPPPPPPPEFTLAIEPAEVAYDEPVRLYGTAVDPATGQPIAGGRVWLIVDGFGRAEIGATDAAGRFDIAVPSSMISFPAEFGTFRVRVMVAGALSPEVDLTILPPPPPPPPVRQFVRIDDVRLLFGKTYEIRISSTFPNQPIIVRFYSLDRVYMWSMLPTADAEGRVVTGFTLEAGRWAIQAGSDAVKSGFWELSVDP